MTKSEEARIERTALNFFRCHPDLNNEANYSLLLEEGARLLLPMDSAESWEICLLSCGSRLAKVESQPATPLPPVDERPQVVRKADEILEAMEEQPSYENTKEELRAMIRRQAERKLAASRQRESKRQISDDRKESANPAHMMTALMGQGEKQ